MRREGPLRGRIVATFTLAALAVSAFFVVVGFHTAARVENRLIAGRLGAIAQ
jgi:hypothetical protein